MLEPGRQRASRRNSPGRAWGGGLRGTEDSSSRWHPLGAGWGCTWSLWTGAHSKGKGDPATNPTQQWASLLPDNMVEVRGRGTEWVPLAWGVTAPLSQESIGMGWCLFPTLSPPFHG